MKRFLFLITLLTITLFITAQNIKRVAILETVDKYDKVDYGVEFQLRAFITDAVNKTPGFEGYDRVDMSQINKEHNFQRTGMVSDADIKKLGEMTGASSIVVAEAAAYGSDDRIIIAAKIINIESGRIENSTRPKVASTSDNGMETACNAVVAELLGKSSDSYNSKGSVQSSPSKQSVSQEEYVDLGLPSGTLWKKTNEKGGYYDYDSAVSEFGTRLPTKEQWEELMAECQWSRTGSGYKVTGNNGKTIILPAAGFRLCTGIVSDVGSWGDYWSSSSNGSEEAWSLFFNPAWCADMYRTERCYGYSVRLVHNP